MAGLRTCLTCCKAMSCSSSTIRRVLPARLFAYRVGVHAQSAGHAAGRAGFLRSRIEVLLLRRVAGNSWDALVRPGRKIRVGERLTFEAPPGVDLGAEVTGRGPLGLRQLCFYGGFCGTDECHAGDRARRAHAAATLHPPPGRSAATASAIRRCLHASLGRLLRRRQDFISRRRSSIGFETGAPKSARSRLRLDWGRFNRCGRNVWRITGFMPRRTRSRENTAEALAAAKRRGRRVLAVGTTVVRTLEDAAVKAMATRRP